MDAVAALQQIYSVQYAFEIIATLILTAYLFPRQALVEENQEFDMIVVGAGAAGTVVALRLAQCNLNVLLIDAGGDPPVQSLLPGLFPYLSHTEVDWNYTNVRVDDRFQCHRDRTINLTAGHVLGGGTSDNYMVYVRGCPGDFRYWAEAANDSSWDYEGLLPFFKKSERLEDRQILSSRYRKYHGTKGFLGVTKNESPAPHIIFHAFRELGNAILLDVNGDRSLGYSELLVTIAEGVRQSTAYAILAKYKFPNLKVLKNTLVNEVLFDDQNNAIGVKAKTEDNKEITLRARKEVILSAGSFNTAKLLMLSGIGPKEHLESLNITVRKDLPVGKNLQDHAPIIMSFKMEGNDNPPPPTDPHKFPFAAYAGYVALNKTQKCPTYQAIGFLIPANSRAPLNLCSFNYAFDFNICQNLYEAGRNRNTLYTTFSLLHPESRGEVLLRSTDPEDPPLIDVGYLKDERDVETLVDSAMDYVRVLNTTFFRSINAEMVDLKLNKCEGFVYMSREWWRCYVKCMQLTIYHYSGTCSLGKVVDSKLRVLGVERLRVVDASVIPRLPGANTNAAVIAIGEKGADIIRRQYSCPANSQGHESSNIFPSWAFSGFFNKFFTSQESFRKK